MSEEVRSILYESLGRRLTMNQQFETVSQK